MSNVIVFAEQRDGRLKKAALEALSEGRRLADAAGGTCTAVVVGAGIEGLAAACGEHGADRVLLAEHDQLATYVAETYRDAIVGAVEQASGAVVLLAASAMGIDLAPRVAARLGVGCLSDVVELRLDGTNLVGRRPVYAGKAFATSVLSSQPALATLRPNVFAIADSPRAAEVGRLTVDPSTARARVVRVEEAGGAELDVAEADIVVAGGRGLKAPENFALIRELATELGAAVGASRAVVDAGWIDHSRQVGQTGKTVSPKLYIACGISGAIQHLAGMSSSRVIVAINKDPDAPIFKHATYGIVGDLFEVVPALIKALQAYRAEHA